MIGGADILFNNCRFTNHRAYSDIIYGSGTQAAFTDCAFSGNKRAVSGIIDIFSGIAENNVLFLRCRFTDNAPASQSDAGYVINGRGVSVKDCHIELGAFKGYWNADDVTDLGGNELAE